MYTQILKSKCTHKNYSITVLWVNLICYFPPLEMANRRNSLVTLILKESRGRFYSTDSIPSTAPTTNPNGQGCVRKGICGEKQNQMSRWPSWRETGWKKTNYHVIFRHLCVSAFVIVPFFVFAVVRAFVAVFIFPSDRTWLPLSSPVFCFYSDSLSPFISFHKQLLPGLKGSTRKDPSARLLFSGGCVLCIALSCSPHHSIQPTSDSLHCRSLNMFSNLLQSCMEL